MGRLSNKGIISALSRVINEPSLILDEVIKGSVPIENKLRENYFKWNFGQGVNIMAEDWDNLILLDACRFDIFKERNTIEGDLDYVFSKGSHSKEFYKKNFPRKKYSDTIVITANPYTPTLGNDVFFRMETTFSNSKIIEEHNRVEKVETSEGNLLEATHINNVHPNRLNKLAIQANEKYPNKRLIVHYMQPHAPYIGEEAQKLRESFKKDGYEFEYWSDLEKIKGNDKITTNLLTLAINGGISAEDLKCVYRENLDIVLDYVDELLSILDGKTIVTSDHGELLGDRMVWDRKSGRQRFGHYEKIYNTELRRVPWLTVNSNSRRNIIKNSRHKNDEVNAINREEQLKLLGYK